MEDAEERESNRLIRSKRNESKDTANRKADKIGKAKQLAERAMKRSEKKGK